MTPLLVALHLVNGAACSLSLWGKAGIFAWTTLLSGALMVAALIVFIQAHSKPPAGVEAEELPSGIIRMVALLSFMTAIPWALVGLYALMTVPLATGTMIHAAPVIVATGSALMLSGIPVAAIICFSTILGPLAVLAPFLSPGADWRFSLLLAVYMLLLGAFCLRHAQLLTLNERDQHRQKELSDELAAALAINEDLINTDPLTGLPNRRHFNTLLSAALRKVNKDAVDVALPVYLINIDNFKAINDMMGHHVGDLYLKNVSKRLSHICAQGWTVSRLGGDEFAIIPSDCLPISQIADFGMKIIDTLGTTMMIDGRMIKSGGSVACAHAPHHTTDARELMIYADDALTIVKDSGRGQFGLFDIEARNRRRARDDDAEFLKLSALETSIVMAYQPQIDLVTRRLVGFEALVRWNHPLRGLTGPMYLLDLAEEKGVILDLSDLIFRKVADDVRQWRSMGAHFGRISVNVHQSHLLHPESLFRAAVNLGAAAGGNEAITLEITENAIIGRGTHEVKQVLDNLTRMGFRISLDDFGTGFSSLTHLTDLPISELKIDRQFVQGITAKVTKYAVVKSVFDMARMLGIDIVAEGVETREQEQTINALGRMTGQGYLYGKPQLFDATTELISAKKSGPMAAAS